MRRREFLRVLGLGGLAAAAPRTAGALGEAPMGVARLAIPGLADPRPGALTDLLKDVAENSSVQPNFDVPEIDPGSDAIFSWPFVVFSGAQSFDPLPDEAIANLRLYLREGGFLFIDDATALESSGFDRSVRRDLARVLPGTKLGTIGRDHAIYRSFFLLRGVSGRVIVTKGIEGMWLGDITPVLYCRNDLLGALWRSSGGTYSLDVIPGGRRQRTEAIKLGINLVLFALTGNYKRDVVHVKTLLKRMRRQGGYSVE